MDKDHIETESSDLRLVGKQVGNQVVVVAGKEHPRQAVVEGKYSVGFRKKLLLKRAASYDEYTKRQRTVRRRVLHVLGWILILATIAVVLVYRGWSHGASTLG